jgi:ATP-dependent DNA ligase
MRNLTPLWFMERDITTFENSLEGIVSKRKDSAYRSGRSADWLKMKNPTCEAVRREEEEDWGRDRWR